jgi:hypothetical protein
VRTVLVAALVLLLTAGAATAGSPTRIVAPGPIGALAADGARAAFTVVRSPGDCDRVRVWNMAAGGVSKLGRRTHCIATSTGHGISSLALAGRRTLWLHYVGGNLREWSLWTATTTRPLPLRLAAVTLDVDIGSPIVVGSTDSSLRSGGLLPYANGRDVVVLQENGSRALSWRAPESVTALAVNGSRLAVALADGRILTLNGTAVVDEEAGTPPASAVFVTATGVIAQRGRTVVRYGSDEKSVQLPSRSTLTDAQGNRAVYVARGAVHLLDLGSGADRIAAFGTLAQLEGTRLVVANGRVLQVMHVR